MNIDLNHPEIAFAVSIVRKASHLSHRVQAGMAIQGLTKSDFSPVTVADYSVQALVGHAMDQTFPEAVLVGEESSIELRKESGATMLEVVTRFLSKMAPDATPDAVCQWIDRGNANTTDRFWTIDPIDGTKGYLRGGQYAVALALIEDGEVQLGILGCPNLGANCLPEICGEGAIVVAQRGKGSWYSSLSDETGPFKPLQVSACTDPAEARILRSVESGHTNAEHVEEIARQLGIQAEPVRMDSQAKYATLAAGGGELLLRLLSPNQMDYREKIWDQAAGSIILEEAGGKITDLNGNKLDFSQGRRLEKNTGVFASNTILHDAGLNAIAKVCG